MNLRDATKIINKADTGITLNKSEQKLAELMLHSHSQSDMMRNIHSVQDFLRQNPATTDALIDFNAIADSTVVAVKDIEDSDLHHVLKVCLGIHFPAAFDQVVTSRVTCMPHEKTCNKKKFYVTVEVTSGMMRISNGKSKKY